MNTRIAAVCIFVCALSLGFIYYHFDQPVTYAVGDQWIYQHTGPRPFKDPSEALNGDRIREIIRCETSNGESTWVFRDQWGDPEQYTICYVDANHECSRFEEENNVIIDNEKPLPFDYPNLAINETKEYDSDVSASGLPEMNIHITATRLSDESVQTPAGTFNHCRHIQVETKVTVTDQAPPMVPTYTENYWFHDSVNGFVKYELVFDPIEMNGVVIDGYTACSELKQFIKGNGAELKTIAREESA
ncbi:hypothetical protein K8I31_03340 [bacterium]|nr:hypothetical protein [bacterium]